MYRARSSVGEVRAPAQTQHHTTTCQFTTNPAQLPANGSATVSLYLDTDSVIGYARTTPAPLDDPRTPYLTLLLPTVGHSTLLRRRTRLRLLPLLAALCLTLPLTGCGSIIFPVSIPPSVALGIYLIPITATGATTGLTHTTQLTLTVTP